MKMASVISTILGLVIGLPVVAAGVLLATFDADGYRPRIAEALSKKLERGVDLNGAIKLGVSLRHGFDVSVSDVSVANAAWANGPYLLKVGRVELGVGLKPLFQRRLDITALKLADVDVQLETNADGHNNWTLKLADEKAGAGASKEVAASAPVSVQVSRVEIDRARVTLRGKDGKQTVYNVDSLTLDHGGEAIKLRLVGNLGEAPVQLVMTGKIPDQPMKAAWPFQADVDYAALKLHAEGTLDTQAKRADVSLYEVTSGATKVTGKLAANWGGARPAVTGTLNSERVRVADLKMEAGGSEAESVASSAPRANGTGRLFSDEPLNLAGLKAVDAKFDVAIAELTVGLTTMKQVQTRLDLANGRLLLSPFSAMVAGSKAEGQLKLDGSSSPAQASVILKAYQMDLSDLAQIGGLESFISGKGDLDLDVAAMGRSPHELASSADGQFNMIVAGGALSSRVLGEIAGTLLNAFAPGTGSLANTGLNCMAARFKIANGVMQTNGLLLDTAQATLAATGDINLGEEKIDMLLRTRAKAVDVSAFTPPLRISGPLMKPHFAPDAVGGAQKIAGLLMGTATGENSGVPAIQAQAGQNACLYTLEHPQASNGASTNNGALQDTVNKAQDKIKDVGGKLLKGLFGQ